ncbi:hypothetical protein GCM10010495_80320 [Kitasatospora herbaricolor]|nr:NAD(P)-dependent dehydrogenase (short-subunit alcohol dehydrogenase family) [Kitasatospora herbaricolor]GGV50601.1 hypothetical protein GCM10010495_80320 [Kitasatospora herbaricolor]
MSRPEGLAAISTGRFDRVVKTDLYALFLLCKAALPHLRPGASIIDTASVRAYRPSPHLLDYATAKGAVVTFTQGLAQQLAPEGIRVNAVAPGPVWTPLVPATTARHYLRFSGSGSPVVCTGRGGGNRPGRGRTRARRSVRSTTAPREGEPQPALPKPGSTDALADQRPPIRRSGQPACSLPTASLDRRTRTSAAASLA